MGMSGFHIQMEDNKVCGREESYGQLEKHDILLALCSSLSLPISYLCLFGDVYFCVSVSHLHSRSAVLSHVYISYSFEKNNIIVDGVFHFLCR